jgi:hypothetical protein
MATFVLMCSPRLTKPRPSGSAAGTHRPHWCHCLNGTHWRSRARSRHPARAAEAESKHVMVAPSTSMVHINDGQRVDPSRKLVHALRDWLSTLSQERSGEQSCKSSKYRSDEEC